MLSLLLQQFSTYLYQVGYGAGSCETLPRLVAEFIQQQQLTDITCVDQREIKSFYAYLQERPLKRKPGGLSDSMISQYVYALNVFFSWLEVTEQLVYNPISGLRFKRGEKQTREPLSLTAVQGLFSAAESEKETAVLHLFYSLGLRRSEGEELNSSDVRFKEQLLYVRAGKGAKRRVVPMTEKVAQQLERYYLNERCGTTANKVQDEAAFMLNRLGGRMNGSSFNELLKRIVQRTAIDPETTLHRLRHSIATHLLQGGMKLEQVRDFLGHRALETTQGYAKVEPTQLLLL